VYGDFASIAFAMRPMTIRAALFASSPAAGVRSRPHSAGEGFDQRQPFVSTGVSRGREENAEHADHFARRDAQGTVISCTGAVPKYASRKRMGSSLSAGSTRVVAAASLRAALATGWVSSSHGLRERRDVARGVSCHGLRRRREHAAFVVEEVYDAARTARRRELPSTHAAGALEVALRSKRVVMSRNLRMVPRMSAIARPSPKISLMRVRGAAGR